MRAAAAGSGWCEPGSCRPKRPGSRLTACRRAWWRREGERLILALPLEKGKPFPLETLFCLALVREVEGMACAVFAFDGGEEPLPP